MPRLDLATETCYRANIVVLPLQFELGVLSRYSYRNHQNRYTCRVSVFPTRLVPEERRDQDSITPLAPSIALVLEKVLSVCRVDKYGIVSNSTGAPSAPDAVSLTRTV